MGTQISLPGSSNSTSNVVYVQTSPSPSITGGGPTSLIGTGIGSLVIPANTLVEGSTYRYSMGGVLDNNNVSGEGLKITIGLDNPSTPVSLTGPTTLVYPMPAFKDVFFKIEGEFTITGTGVVLTSVLFTCGDNTVPVSPNVTSAYSSTALINTTVPYTFILQAGFSSLLVTNKIASNTFVLEKIK